MFMENKEYIGVVGLVLTSALWGFAYIAADFALEGFSPLLVSAYRFYIAFVIMLCFKRKKIKEISISDIRLSLLPSIAMFLVFVLQIYGLKYSTASRNAFLIATNVAFVPFVSKMMYDERIIAKSLFAGFISFQGGDIGASSLFGDLLSLGAGIATAFMIVFNGNRVKRIDFEKLEIIEMGIVSLLFLIFQMLMPKESVGIISKSAILGLIYLGLAGTALCFMILTYSQEYLSETKASIILSTEAVFALLFSLIFIGEKIRSEALIGSFLILLAALVSQIEFKRKG